ncbi:MAG: mechanosensitive ion channel family protein [Gammaproteobacteria bacterium]|nr:mechanosensitive ion channel family protein [Gammaproteobacteria bacterium]MDH3768008.1 mechanosensitive ion channel family protein [Gammaproteobacteria bacterium]
MAQDTNTSENTQVVLNEGPAIAEQLPDFVDYLPDALQPYWGIVAQYPIVGALIIALIFFAIAYVVRAIVLRSVLRLTKHTSSTLDDAIVQLLSRPIFNTVAIFGLTLATRAAQLPESITGITINLLLSIIVVIWMMAAFRLAGILFRALAGVSDRFRIVEERTIPLFDLITKLAAILIGSYALLMIWGINPAGWLASAGIVGIAVGFAAKDTLANLFSGFFILADAPYQIGDYINLDTGERGKVTHLGMRSTRLLTRDDIEITVPNAVIGNAKIINESGGPWEKLRVRIAVGVAYGSDVDDVCKVLMSVADGHSEVCRDPRARVRMRAFGPSSLDFELLCWINRPEDRGRTRHELYMAVYRALNNAGIEIPYAKQDVYIKEMPVG